MSLMIGEITSDGKGEIVKLIHDPDLCKRFRIAERLNEQVRKQIFELLRENAEEFTLKSESRWDEAAKLAGYESCMAAHAQGVGFMLDYGTNEIVVSKQFITKNEKKEK